MKTASDQDAHFFVDESGDPVFYDNRGNLIVGKPGCSRILMLGYTEIAQPELVRQQLIGLRDQIKTDSFFSDVPSVKETLRAFHAKNDIPEIRERFYRLISTMNFKAHLVVARKIEGIFPVLRLSHQPVV